jgi:hypothetical protein
LTNQKKVRLSIRLNPELYDLVISILPLFDSFTETLEYILKQYESCPDHLEQLEKIDNLRSFMLKLENRFSSKNIGIEENSNA